MGKDHPSIQDVLNYINATRHSRLLLAVGSVSDVADLMEHWFRTRAADGFIICPAYYPSGLDAFTNDVIPELQRRGLYKADYSGNSFQHYFSLPIPGNQFSHAPPQETAPA